MWLLPLSVPLGMLIGRVAGGRWRTVYKVRIRWWGLLVAAISVGGFMAVYPNPPGGNLWLLGSLALFAVVAGANRQLGGMGVVLVGICLNLVPVVSNGHMPVRADAVVNAGLADADTFERVRLGTGRKLADPGDRFVALGPVIPVASLHEVVSFGDLIVAFGLVNVGFRLVKPDVARAVRRRPAHAAGSGPARSEVLPGPIPPSPPPSSTPPAPPGQDTRRPQLV